MSFVYLSLVSCTCGRIIGDRFMHYTNMIETGTSHMDALNFLGLNRICCRTNIISATPYILRNGNTGTTSIKQTKSDATAKKSLNLSVKHKKPKIVSGFSRPEPKQEFDYDFLKGGEVAVIGYERDESGEIVMVDVGDQPGNYLVPRLLLCHGVARHNIV